MIDEQLTLTFADIIQRLHALDLPPVDHVVGVATGGIVPASLIAHQLHKPLSLIHINFRAPDKPPQRPQPALLAADLPAAPCRILLVDDVSVSGATLATARRALPGYAIITLVLKGQADYVLFPDVGACVNWPWKIEHLHPVDTA